MIWYEYNERISAHENIHAFLFKLPKKLKEIGNVNKSNIRYKFYSNVTCYDWLILEHVPRIRRSVYYTICKTQFMSLSISFDLKERIEKINTLTSGFHKFITFEHIWNWDRLYKILWVIRSIVADLVKTVHIVFNRILIHLNCFVSEVEDNYRYIFHPLSTRHLRVAMVLQE